MLADRVGPSRILSDPRLAVGAPDGSDRLPCRGESADPEDSWLLLIALRFALGLTVAGVYPLCARP